MRKNLLLLKLLSFSLLDLCRVASYFWVCAFVRVWVPFYLFIFFSAYLSSKTWGTECDEHTEACASPDNNQLLHNLLTNTTKMCYLLPVILMVTQNGTEKHLRGSCLADGKVVLIKTDFR